MRARKKDDFSRTPLSKRKEDENGKMLPASSTFLPSFRLFRIPFESLREKSVGWQVRESDLSAPRGGAGRVLRPRLLPRDLQRGACAPPPRCQQTLDGSFSAVSTATITTKGSFCSIFEIYKICIPLHLWNLRMGKNWNSFAPLRSQRFSKKS